MGYTHHWKLKGFDVKDSEGYLKALPIVRDIVRRHLDILCYEYNEVEKPPEVSEKKIWFNGKGDDGHETFLFQPQAAEFPFCKTARKPYDLPVCEVLLVLKALMPHLGLSSDGFSSNIVGAELDGYWPQAIYNVRRYGLHYDAVVTEERPPYCDMEPTLVSVEEWVKA